MKAGKARKKSAPDSFSRYLYSSNEPVKWKAGNFVKSFLSSTTLIEKYKGKV